MELRVLDSKGRAIEVRPRSEEDLWALAMSLREGDRVRTVVLRDVSGRDAKEKQRRPIEVVIRVESVEFQPFTGSLRVFGVIEEGPDRFGVKGRHQSAYIGLNQAVVVEREGGWDERTLSRLRSSGPRGRAVVVSVDYDGYAVAELTSLGMRVASEVSASLGPKDDPRREERLREMVSEAASEAVRAASELGARVVLVVGPGQLKEEVAAAVRASAPSLRVLTDSTSSGGVEGVYEALRRQGVVEALREIDAVRAREVLDEFLRRLSSGADLVAYTLDEVLEAARAGAVQVAVVSSRYLYSPDDAEREKARQLVEEVESRRGEVIVVGEQYPEVEGQVSSFGGAVALLRFSFNTKK